jgi:hypothetical protein
MADFDKILWGFIFSAIGITIGWILNQLSQWFRTRQEDKKNLKIVLFNLLEIYFILTRSDLDKFVRKVTDKVVKKMPNEYQTEEMKNTIHKIYSEHLISHFKEQLSNEINIVQEDYHKSIQTLAAIDPLTAYYLNGNNNVMEIFDTILNVLNNVKNQFPEGHNEIELGGRKAMEIIKPEFLNDSLLSVEKDIRNIAWKINLFVWFNSIKAIKRVKVNSNDRIDKEIDKLLDKMESVIKIP